MGVTDCEWPLLYSKRLSAKENIPEDLAGLVFSIRTDTWTSRSVSDCRSFLKRRVGEEKCRGEAYTYRELNLSSQAQAMVLCVKIYCKPLQYLNSVLPLSWAL